MVLIGVYKIVDVEMLIFINYKKFFNQNKDIAVLFIVTTLMLHRV